jgi:purine-nucleoside phosphorylase
MVNETKPSVTSDKAAVTLSPCHLVTPSNSGVLSFARFVERAQALPVDAAIVLGSGMSGLADRCHLVLRLPFAEVPGLSATSVVGHTGCLTLGEWGGKRVLLFEGRLHYYEGHPWRSVTQPIQIAHFLGARILLLTNAAGGIHDTLGPGSLMAIRDHIEWTRPYCWCDAGPGSSRPAPYSPRLLQVLTEAGRGLGFKLPPGVYAAVTGPCYETPAEIRALKIWGADAVGMSTAREIQAGHDLGLECAAVSCITNRAAGLSPAPINHEEVLATAAAQTERLSDLLEGCLQRL